jgi:hypothetical protein
MTTEAQSTEALIADDVTLAGDTERDDVRGADAHTISEHRRTQTPGERLAFGEPLRRLMVVALGFLAIVATLCLISAHRGTQISLFDEATHADYAYQIAHGHLPARGSTIAPPILRAWACRGSSNGFALPPCDATTLNPAKFPAHGENYNFGHPPLYYVVTGVLAQAADSLLPGDHFVGSARATGFLWLFSAAVVMYLALRRFGVNWVIAAAGTALLPLCPGVLHASSMVSNDAPAALCGAVALYFLAGVLKTGRIGWIAPTVATLLASATKVLNGLPMLILAGVLMVLAIAQRRRREARSAAQLLIAVGGIVLAFLVVYKGWSIYQSGRGVADWVSPIRGITGRNYSGSPVDEVLSTSFQGFQLISGYFLQPQLNGETITLWSRLLNLVVAAAPLLAIVLFRPRTPEWALGVATLGGMLAYPMIVEMQVLVSLHEYFPVVTPRYGMSLIPFALACLAVVTNTLRLRRTAVAYAGIGTLVMLLAATGVWSIGPA